MTFNPNIENLQKVRDAIAAEKLPDGSSLRFDMTLWRYAPKSYPECGTAACIGGTAESIMRHEIRDIEFTESSVSKWLGLPRSMVSALFFAYDSPVGLEAIRWGDALHALDSIIGGKPFTDWKDYVPEARYAKA